MCALALQKNARNTRRCVERSVTVVILFLLSAPLSATELNHHPRSGENVVLSALSSPNALKNGC
ncbi:Uncharacterised protein [Vibrio cholerae]|nr:Uncharacterised protein [Vibrio cholerae]